MSNIKKGSKLTVSTANGISRASSNNLGILEVSGPGLANVVSQDSTFSLDSSNIPQITIGAIDNSGIFQLGLDNQGNAVLESTENGNNNNVLIQQLGGYVGIGTNNPASTLHVNSTDGLIIPVGTTTNRPGESGQITAQTGMIRYNTTTSQFEGYGPGSTWGSLGGVKDVDGDTYILSETSPGADNDDLQFFTGGTQRMVVTDSGTVGIGTPDVSASFHVRRDVTSGSIYQDLVGDPFPGSTTACFHIRDTNYTSDNEYGIVMGTEVYHGKSWIQSKRLSGAYHNYQLLLNPDGGNVGINTTNASGGVLHVQGNIYSSGKILGEVGGSSLIVGDNTTYQIATAPTNGMLVQGNVGIGTTTPGTYRLSVQAGRSQFYYRQSDGVSEELMNLSVSTDVNGHSVPQLQIESTPRGYHTTYATIQLKGSEAGSQSWRAVNYGCGIRARGGYINREYADLSIWTTNSSTNTKQDVMTINSAANVGIGTTNPGGKLEINGNGELLRFKYSTVGWISFYEGSTYRGFMGPGNSGNDNIYVTAYGGHVILQETGQTTYNVGIGVTNPSQKLEVDGNIDIKGTQISISPSTEQNYTYFSGVNSVYTTFQGNKNLHLKANNGKIYFTAGTSGSSIDRMIIDSNGYVGIGAMSPRAKFQIAGPENDSWTTGTTAGDCHMLVGGYEWGTQGTNKTLKIGLGYFDNASANVPMYIGARIITSGDDTTSALVFGTRNSHLDTTATEERMCILPNGDVGIGTTTGLTNIKFSIVGNSARYSNLAIQNTTAATTGFLYLQMNDDGKAYVLNGTNNPLILGANNQVQLYLNNNGNVGIGTTNPLRTLDFGNNGGDIRISGIAANDSAPERKIGRFYSGNNIFYSGIVFGTDGNDDYLAFHTHKNNVDLGERMRIEASGKVGIGTTTPSEKVWIQSGNLALYSNYTTSTGSAGNSNILLDCNNYPATTTNGIKWKPIYNAGANNYTTRNFSAAVLFQPEADYFRGGLVFYTHGFPDEATDATEKMRINSLGNVGIGTASMFTKLDVNGTTSTQGLQIMSSDISANTDTRPAITSRSSTVGIKDYEIAAIPNNYTNRASNHGWDHGFLRIRAGGGNAVNQTSYIDLTGYSQVADMTRNIVFGTSGTERMRIDKDGNVGIGTPNPSAPLHIFSREGEPTNHIKDMIKIETEYNDFNGSNREGGASILFYVENHNGGDGQGTPGEAARIVAGCDEISNTSEYHSYLAFHTSNNSSSTGTIERMVIRHNGDVGIGTTSPYCQLQLGSLGAGGNVYNETKHNRIAFPSHAHNNNRYLFANRDPSSLLAFLDLHYVHDTASYNRHLMTFTNQGTVGIATTAPKSGLQVFHNQGLTVSATQTTGERTAILRLGSPYDTDVATIENYCAKITSTNNHSQNYGADLRFYTHPNNQSFSGSLYESTERMRIRGDTGNIGIGVTNPSTMLQVQGQIHSYDKITGKSGGEFGVGTPTDYSFSVERKIKPSDGAGGDEFSRAVDVYGNYAIMGAFKDDDNGTDSGSAYIFDITTGTQIHKLRAGDAAASEMFGLAVAISANYAIVGAPYSNQSPGTDSGAAYIFDIRTGNQIYELTGSDLQGGAEFGWSVAIDNKHAAVGARLMNASATNVGRIYVFELETGTQILNTLMPSVEQQSGDQLGYSVAIAGDYAAAGAVYDDDTGYSNSGTVYVFNIHTGSMVHKLFAGDHANQYFGASVAMSGNYLIVGANGSNSMAGKAYIFDVTTGTELHILTASDAAADDNFGNSVAISGNYAIVGGHGNDDNSSGSGSAYIFDVRTGSQVKKITASDAAGNDNFGYRVGIFGSYVIVSSNGDDDNGSASGSAYIYGPAVLNPPTLDCSIPETVEINGNVGIGTSTPKSILNIVKKSKYPSEGEDKKMKRFHINWNTDKTEAIFYRIYYGLRYSFFKHVNSQRLDGDTDPDGYAIMYKNKYNITEWLKGINVDISFNSNFTSFPYYDGASTSPSIFDAATVSFRAKQDCDFLLLSQAYCHNSWEFHGYAMVYDLYNNDYYTMLFPHSDDTTSFQNGLSPAISLKAGRYYKIYFYTILYRYQYGGGNDYVYAWQTIPQSTLTSTTSPTAGYNLRSVHSNDISSNITEWFTQVNESDYIEWLDEHDVSLKLGDSQSSFSINDPASTAPLSVAKEYFHDLSNNTVAEFKGTYPVKIKDDGYIESRGINNIRMTRELTKVSVTQWEDTTGSAPSGRYESATWLAHDRYIYIRGGYTSTYTYGLYRYDLSGGSWTSFGNTSFSGIYTADVYDHENDILYFFGGAYAGGKLNGLNKYTFGADGNYIGYSLAANGATGNPAAREAARMVLYENCLYMFGGRNGSTYYNDMWKFDLATNTWTELSSNGNSLAADKRAFHNMEVYNGFIYIQGGYVGSANIDSTASFFMFDLHRRSSDAWTNIHLSQADYIPHWNHRYGQSVLVDNYMLIWGGVAKNQHSGTTEKTSDYMFIVDLDNHTVERQTVPNAMVHCHSTHYSKKLGKFFTVMGYDSKINQISPSGRILEYTPYFSTVMKNNAEDINAWLFRESTGFNTYTWVQMLSYVRKYSVSWDGEQQLAKYDLPTVQWCLAHSKELEYRTSQIDTWVPCYDENGEKAWIHLGTTNHAHLKLHYPYPTWGDTNTSYSYRRAVVMVCRNKRTTDLKIEANHLIVRGESSSHGRPQDALIITNHCSGQSGYLSSGTLDTTTKVTSMAILAPGENQLSAIYFGSNTQGRKFASRKTAIMCEGVHSYDRGKLHFCLQGVNHTDGQNVSIADSKMQIDQAGRVGIGTPAQKESRLHINAGDARCCRMTVVGANSPHYQSNFLYGAHHIDVYNSSTEMGFGDTGNAGTLHLNYYSQGSVTAARTTISSDDRLKHNEKIITNGLDIINQLEPKKYFKSLKRYDEDYNYELDNSGNPITDDIYHIETGLIAQQVMTINDLKYLVEEIEDKYLDTDVEKVDESGNVVMDLSGNPIMEKKKKLLLKGRYTVNYKDIFVYNIAATKELYKNVQTLQTDLSNATTTIQQQATTIQEQATKITTLETQIADILTRLSNLENTGSA